MSVSRTESAVFLSLFFFFPQCSQMLGFVSYLHKIKSKLLVAGESVERRDFSPTSCLGVEGARDMFLLAGTSLGSWVCEGGGGVRGQQRVLWTQPGHADETRGAVCGFTGQGDLSVSLAAPESWVLSPRMPKQALACERGKETTGKTHL